MIGLYGGTFAPVHIGHLRFALEAREQLSLSAVHLLVSAQPPHRDRPSIDGARRHAWVQQACADCSGLVADDDEIRHSGPSYTVDTMARARARFPGQTLLWLLGADAFNGLHCWHNWSRLFELGHCVVASRPGHSLAPDAAVAAYPRLDVDGLRAAASGGWHALHIPELDVSSSGIRARLRDRRSIRGLVPDRVLDNMRADDHADLAASA